jgi:hypothetical protein
MRENLGNRRVRRRVRIEKRFDLMRRTLYVNTGLSKSNFASRTVGRLGKWISAAVRAPIESRTA